MRPGRQVQLDLRRYQVDGPAALGDVDVISGGAITNAALYALLRIPEITAAIRVIEPETLDLSNLNRYALALASMTGWLKTHALTSYQTPRIRITGDTRTFSAATAPLLAPLAPRLLVGVDHIPSRWAAQQAAASHWVCVGSSSHDFVLVSAHPAGSACTGCVHTRDDEMTGDIPTISFVSFWAGLIQALELLATPREGHRPGPEQPTSGPSAWITPEESTHTPAGRRRLPRRVPRLVGTYSSVMCNTRVVCPSEVPGWRTPRPLSSRYAAGHKAKLLDRRNLGAR